MKADSLLFSLNFFATADSDVFSEIFIRYIGFSVTDKGSNLLSLLIPLTEIHDCYSP